MEGNELIFSSAYINLISPSSINMVPLQQQVNRKPAASDCGESAVRLTFCL